MLQPLSGLIYVKFFFIFTFSYENKPLTDILTALLSRVKLSDIQLAAARCLTYIHRSDSLTSTDSRIVYRTLPCLARLCTTDFDEETRATAAETLAYLAEVMIHSKCSLYCLTNPINTSFPDRFRTSTTSCYFESFDKLVIRFIEK